MEHACCEVLTIYGFCVNKEKEQIGSENGAVGEVICSRIQSCNKVTATQQALTGATWGDAGEHTLWNRLAGQRSRFSHTVTPASGFRMLVFSSAER